MAKLELTLNGPLKTICDVIEKGILDGSSTATLKDLSDFTGQNACCSVRIFERYSHLGGNRVSLSVALFQDGNGPVHLSAVTSGGSQAMFVKINTFGEKAFLDKLEKLLIENGYIQ